MSSLRYLTGGESHGPWLVGILDGLPAGLPLSAEDLLPRMARRRGAAGRGARMAREADRPEIVGGTWRGVTTGAPLAILIANAGARPARTPRRGAIPRPGHADLAGMIKYGFAVADPVIERASARETAMRTALGGAACRLLERLGARIVARVVELGGVAARPLAASWSPRRIETARDASPVACCDVRATAAMLDRIEQARQRGETLGGRIELVVFGLPPGLGAYAQADRRLDSRLGAALLAIPSVKEVELGDVLAASRDFGRAAQDVIVRRGSGLARASNRAGGLEGGVSNGQPLLARLTFKPISTQRRPLPSVDLRTGKPSRGRYVRSDVTVVPAATPIVEAVAGLVLADALLEKFGGDALGDIEKALAAYRRRAPRWPRRGRR